MMEQPKDERTEAGIEETIPVIEERLEVQRRKRESGTVRVRVIPHEEHHVVDDQVLHDEVDVTRVPVERWVEAPEQERWEDGKVIVPLHREVLVIERRLQVFEELHITPQHRQERHREEITLRREEAVIEREKRSP
jgi:stress response protein YsnF